MKFTIEVDDFWLGEAELEPALKRFIVNDVVEKITKSIQDKVDKQITEKVNEIANSRLSYMINDRIKELLETGILVTGTGSNRKDIKFIDHINNLFNSHHGWHRPDEVLQKIAKAFGEELKAQYNNIFAAKIVQNMREQGMLREDVAQLLLNGKKD